MPEGAAVLGTMYWNLGLKGTLAADVSKAEADINKLDGTTQKAEGTMTKFEGITKKNAREMKLMGAGVASVGGAIMMAGVAVRGMGDQFEGLSNILVTAGTSLAAIGMVTSQVFPAVRALAIAQGSTMVNALKNMILGEQAATFATLTLAQAMRVLAAASVIGLVLVGLYLLYTHLNAAKREAAALQKEIDRLSNSIDGIQTTINAYNYSLKEAEKNNERLKESVKEYDDEVKNLTDDLETLIGIERDRTDLALDIREAQLDLNDAIAEARADPGDERKMITAARAQERLNDLLAEKAEMDKKAKEIGPRETVEKNLADTAMKAQIAKDKQLLVEKEILAIKEAQLKAESALRAAEFMQKLLEWKKEGYVPSKEQLAIFAQVPEYAAAMASMPPSETLTYMQWWKAQGAFEAGTGPRPAPYGTKFPSPYYMAPFVQSEWQTSPGGGITPEMLEGLSPTTQTGAPPAQEMARDIAYWMETGKERMVPITIHNEITVTDAGDVKTITEDSLTFAQRTSQKGL